MSTKLRQLRIQKLNELEQVEESLRIRLQRSYAEASELSALQSVSLGLYEELDKLTKKLPAEQVTNLVLSQLNDIVRETKKLVVDDVYVQKLTEFVAAGDNPEQRDALVMLRQTRQGLDRHTGTIKRNTSVLNAEIRLLELLKSAVRTFLNDGSSIKKSDLEFGVRDSYPEWFNQVFPHEFNFQRLDSTDFFAYFDVQ